MTRVVNIYKEECQVYIGRAGHGQDGYFGNPVKKWQRCYVCKDMHRENGETIPCYRKYFEERMRDDPEFRDQVESLRGKVLGCFCKPGPCHGDVIVEYLETHPPRSA